MAAGAGPRLPLDIPVPVARGEPAEGYPYRWSVYRWLEGEPAATARISDLTGFASELAAFLNALHRADATGGPEPGEHNFFRGGPLATYEREALEAVEALGDEIPRAEVERVWREAISLAGNLGGHAPVAAAANRREIAEIVGDATAGTS